MFSRPEQTVKKLAQQVEAGIYDPVSQRFEIVNQLIRADTVTQYAAIAFVNGWYAFIGEATVLLFHCLSLPLHCVCLPFLAIQLC
eukprot:SAG22_NODE_1245_length_5020_cov_1.424304_8_plen_85_part_00